MLLKPVLSRAGFSEFVLLCNVNARFERSFSLLYRNLLLIFINIVIISNNNLDIEFLTGFFCATT